MSAVPSLNFPTITVTTRLAGAAPEDIETEVFLLPAASDASPGDQVVQSRTRDFCSKSVGAWLDYPVDYDFGYSWFHRAEWDAGNRRSVVLSGRT